MAKPTVAPICWAVLRMPDAKAPSGGSTRFVAIRVIGKNVRPRPRLNGNTPSGVGQRSRRYRRFGEALSDTVLSGFHPNAGATSRAIVSSICALYSTPS
jgi:hypothetical protein